MSCIILVILANFGWWAQLFRKLKTHQGSAAKFLFLYSASVLLQPPPICSNKFKKVQHTKSMHEHIVLGSTQICVSKLPLLRYCIQFFFFFFLLANQCQFVHCNALVLIKDRLVLSAQLSNIVDCSLLFTFYKRHTRAVAVFSLVKALLAVKQGQDKQSSSCSDREYS